MMRWVVGLFCALGCARFAAADLIISEVYAAGSGNLTYASDWFEVTNTGASAFDISGWRIDDSSNNFAASAALNNISSIAAGQSVIFMEATDAELAGKIASFNQVWYGSSTSSLAFGNYSGSGLGLSTNSDSVILFNAAGVSQLRVDFATSTTGRTFDNAAGLNNATISLLSSAGVNGAFTSFNGAEVGSPGTITSVPEPTSLALAGAALVGMVAARRRRIRQA
jgi:hypothetical protein